MKKPARNRWFALRHGRSEHNARVELSCQIETDRSNLLPKSHQQIMNQSLKLQGSGLTKIFASDFIRTRQTAQIVADLTGLTIATDPRLREHDFGELDGASEHDPRLAELVALWSTDPNATRYSAQTPSSVGQRMLDFFLETDSLFHDEVILIVSHGSPVWNLVAKLFPNDYLQLRSTLWPMPGEGLELFPELRKL